jgi:homoserine kinase
MSGPVTVRVPATSANLGPGFDSLGLALDLREEITVAEGYHADPDGLARLVASAARAAFRAAGVPAPAELTVTSDHAIPIGRGLGASAAARAAGIVAANEMMSGALSPDQQLEVGAALEGHADNMAPALFGGLQIVVREDSRFHRHAARIADGLRVVLFIPDFEMPTSEGRKLLPQSLSKDDAVHNIGRAALLVAALTSGDWSALRVATDDRLHQPARSGIFPAMRDIFRAALDAGAHAAYLSGGGSTIAAFATEGEERIARAMMAEAISRGYPGRTAVTSPSSEGATVVQRAAP